ncbi:MAG: HEAT repeat domain-containing protein [Spirochaetales bacterium]|nr:HEAT repeat domain-containing protein [Spirochaetales bacterium]
MIYNLYYITCGITLEAMALYFAYWDQEFFLAPLLFVLAHITGAFYFAKGIYPSVKNKNNWFIALFVFSLCLPVFGFIGIYVFILLRYFRKNKGEVFHLDIDEDKLFCDDEREMQLLEGKTRQCAEILEIEAFADILHGDDKELRLGAINALQKMGDRQSIDILNSSLDNTYQEVRYYAVEALNKLSQEHMDKINLLKSMIEIKPEDHLIRMTLADNYYEYASKGLEEKTIENYYLTCAKDEYTRIIREEQEEIRREDVLKKLCDTYFLLGDYDEAIRVGNEILGIIQDDSWAILRILESYFKKKDYLSIREWSHRYIKNQEIHSEVRQAMEMWI